MSKKLKIGAFVSWPWMGGRVKGTLLEIHPCRLEREIKGKKIVRNGSKENPACVVQSKSGNFAIKLLSELAPLEEN